MTRCVESNNGACTDVSGPVYACPEGYAIMAAREGDEGLMTDVQARAMYHAYLGLEPRATPEALQAFFDEPGPMGFRQRKPPEWRTLVEGRQPDPRYRQIVLVIRQTSDDQVVGLAAAKIPKQRLLADVQPADETVDRITAMHVDPEHQGRGLGAAALKALMGHLGSCVALETVRGTSAVGFYEKHGFTQRPLWLAGVTPLFPFNLMRLPRLAMSCEANYRPKYALSPQSDPSTWEPATASFSIGD